jgi:lysophospholipase L1-like esterase
MKDVLAIGVGAVGATIFWLGASCRPTAPARGELTTIHIAPPPAVPEPVALVPAPPPEPVGPQLLEVPSGALDPLYTALALAESGDAAGRADVLFFGDSHTAGDLLTGYLRHSLQARFGDAGRGFVLAGHPPIKYYTQRDIQCASSGRWTAEQGGKRHASEPFGMAGVRVHSEDKGALAWVESCVGCKTGGDVDRFDVYYLRTKASGTLGYKVDDGDWHKLATKLVPPAVASAGDVAIGSTPPGDTVAATLTVPVDTGHHKITMRPQGGGPVELFGVALERNHPGVLVDSLGVVGRRLAHLFHWDWNVIGPQLAQRDPSLVVIQYGTNEADDPDLELDTLARQYDAVIARIRQHAPRAAILVLGPPDMAVRSRGKLCDHLPPPPANADGTPGEIDPACQWRTPAVLPQIVEVERQAARRNGVAFFDTFTALGGADHMDEFFHQEPSLAYGDHVHFTDKGYQRWGQALLEHLLAGYDHWKQQQPSSTAPSAR